MDIDESLLDVASVSEADAQQLKVGFSDTLLVTLAPSSPSSFPQELTRCIVQVVVTHAFTFREDTLSLATQ